MNNCEMKALLWQAYENIQRVYNALEAAPVNQSTIVDTPVTPMPAESPDSCIGCGYYRVDIRGKAYCSWYPHNNAEKKCFLWFNPKAIKIDAAPCDGVIRECCEEEHNGDIS
jgi:hypothetical protein